MLKRVLHYAGILVGIGIFVAAVWVLSHTLRDLRWAVLLDQLSNMPRSHVALSLLFTAAAYLILTVYDTTAFSYIGRHVSYARVAFVSFISYAFSHSLGFGGLTGGAIRFRFYTGWGVKPADVGKVVLFGGLAYVLGAFAVAGGLILANAATFAEQTDLPVWFVHLFGIGCILGGCAYVVWSAVGRPAIRVGAMSMPPPRLRIPVAQLSVACLEWSFASAALYWLMPADIGVDYWHFVGIYILAYLVGMLSHVPGGLGVLEAVIIALLLPHGAHREAVVAAMITYRAVYFVLPLLVAAALFAAYEIRAGHVHLVNRGRRLQAHRRE